MNNKQLIFNEQARRSVLQGIEKLVNAVGSTLGPGGRNVLIGQNDNPPIATKDGVTVAKNIKLKNPVENIGAQAVIEAASKTADLAGDGTTTASILAASIYKAGIKYLVSGYNPIMLKRGIDKAVDIITACIKEHSKPINNNNEIKQIAVVSANWDEEIGSIIADAIEKVTKDGVVTLEESKTAETYLTVVEGTKFDRGYISPYFVNEEETSKCVFENAYILLHEKKLTNIGELMPILQLIAKSGRPLLIIAEDVDNEVLSTLVVNKLRGTINVCAIKAPGFGDRRKAFLDDLGVLTNGKVCEADLSTKLEEYTLDDLGTARKIIVTKSDVTIIEGAGDKDRIKSRIISVKNQIEECNNDFEKEKFRERLSKLQGAVAIINIGASTEPEMKEKRMRIDDALAATRAAIEEGISVGGSVALLKTYHSLEAIISNYSGNESIKAGMEIVLNSLKTPLTWLCNNAGLDSSIIVNKVLNESPQYEYGFNIASEQFENLLESGVIDPTKVTRLSLQNAASIAGLLLSSECVIYDEESNKDNSNSLNM